jgi:hypothetical protein
MVGSGYLVVDARRLFSAHFLKGTSLYQPLHEIEDKGGIYMSTFFTPTLFSVVNLVVMTHCYPTFGRAGVPTLVGPSTTSLGTAAVRNG